MSTPQIRFATAGGRGTPTTPVDTSPADFSFAPATGVSRSTFVSSGSVNITGIDAPTPISVAAGTEYNVNDAGWMTVPGTVVNNDVVRIGRDSSSSYATEVIASVTIGDKTRTFSITTEAEPTSALTVLAADHKENSTDASSYTFPNVSIAAGSTVFYVTSRGNTGSVPASDLTANGIAGTKIGATISGTTQETSAWLVEGMAGTTAEVVVTFPTTTLRCGLDSRSVGAVTLADCDYIGAGLSSGVASMSATIGAAAGGLVLAHLTKLGATTPGVTWTDANARFVPTAFDGNVYHAGADVEIIVSESRTVTANFTNGNFNNCILALVSISGGGVPAVTFSKLYSAGDSIIAGIPDGPSWPQLMVDTHNIAPTHEELGRAGSRIIPAPDQYYNGFEKQVDDVIAAFLADGSPANAAIIIHTGGNDLKDVTDTSQFTPIINKYQEQILRLRTNTSLKILHCRLPVAYSPELLEAPGWSTKKSGIDLYNSNVESAIAHSRVQVMNFEALMAAMYANPSAYGFTFFDNPEPSGQNPAYVFRDPIHHGAATQPVIAGYMADLL